MKPQTYIHFLFILFLIACTQRENENIIYQDDFESYAVGSFPEGPWQKEGSGDISIDDTRAVSGSKSVRLITGEGYSERGFLKLTGDHFFPIEGNAFYGRVNFWVNSVSPDGIHWTMIEGVGKVPDKDFTAMVRYGGQHEGRFMANYDTDKIQTDCWQHSQIQLIEKKWFNISFYFNGNENVMMFWLNNQLIDDLTIKSEGEGCVGDENNGVWSFPQFEEFLIGWVDYQSGGGTRELWIDDVILSKEPLIK